MPQTQRNFPAERNKFSPKANRRRKVIGAPSTGSGTLCPLHDFGRKRPCRGGDCHKIPYKRWSGCSSSDATMDQRPAVALCEPTPGLRVHPPLKLRLHIAPCSTCMLPSHTWGPCQPPPRGGPRQLHSGPSKRSMLGFGPGWRLRAGVPCLYPALHRMLLPVSRFFFAPHACAHPLSHVMRCHCAGFGLKGLHLGGYCWCYAQILIFRGGSPPSCSSGGVV